MYRYTVYGVSLDSDTPLALEPCDRDADSRVSIRSAAATWFARVRSAARFESPRGSWYHYARLDDGATYLRWSGLGEFVVSRDGRCIRCRRFAHASLEAFQVYLLQRALSFALVKQGMEPLHATAVVDGASAVAFLGDTGCGKSTLAAACLREGDALVTDDLLVLRREGACVLAAPGPHRIKLFAGTARRLLDRKAAAPPMNRRTRKLVLPLPPQRMALQLVPLRAIYVLAPHREHRIETETLPPRAAFHALLKHTFNYLHRDADRLQRLFTEAADISLAVPVKRLHYPRRYASLADVHAHLAH